MGYYVTTQLFGIKSATEIVGDLNGGTMTIYESGDYDVSVDGELRSFIWNWTQSVSWTQMDNCGWWVKQRHTGNRYTFDYTDARSELYGQTVTTSRMESSGWLSPSTSGYSSQINICGQPIPQWVWLQAGPEAFMPSLYTHNFYYALTPATASCPEPIIGDDDNDFDTGKKGRIAFFSVGSDIFYPAFSSITGLSRHQAVSYLLGLPLQYFEIPIKPISGDPVARAIFGDIHAPLWY
jgi:hypothetical protein